MSNIKSNMHKKDGNINVTKKDGNSNKKSPVSKQNKSYSKKHNRKTSQVKPISSSCNECKLTKIEENCFSTLCKEDDYEIEEIYSNEPTTTVSSEKNIIEKSNDDDDDTDEITLQVQQDINDITKNRNSNYTADDSTEEKFLSKKNCN